MILTFINTIKQNGLKKVFLDIALRPPVIAMVASLLVIVILITGYQSFKATEKASFEEFNQRQLIIAKDLNQKVKQYFESLAWALEAVEHSPGVMDFDEVATRQVLALEIHELKRMGIIEIGVIDGNGILRYSAVAQHLEGGDLSGQKYFQDARQMSSSEASIIELFEFEDLTPREKGILIAVPIFKTRVDEKTKLKLSSFSGVVFCTLKLDTLTQKFIAPIKPSERGYAFLIDDNYEVLWMPDDTLIGKNLYTKAAVFPSFQNILAQMKNSTGGTAEYSYMRFDENEGRYINEKEASLIAYVPLHLDGNRWSLAVSAPKSDARKLIRLSYVKQLLMIIFIVIAIIIGSSFTITVASHYNKHLEEEVEEKTKEFKESHQRLLTVFDSLDAWVYVSDMETYEILFVNKYLRKLFGNVTGKECWQVLHKGLSGPCNFCTNKKLLNPDGTPAGVHVRQFQNPIIGKWYEARDRAIRWVDGRFVRLEIAADITERKQVENELRQAHMEMGTFCRIVKEIGVQKTLNGVASFLIKELNTILDKHEMLFFVFGDDREILFTLTDRGTKVIRDPELIRTTLTNLAQLKKGITISPKPIFMPPLLPDYFPVDGKQTVVPLQANSQGDGALIISCNTHCMCEEKELGLVQVILQHASGAIKRAALHEAEIQALQSRIESKAHFSGIVGKDPQMQVIYKLIQDIAPSDATVLIQGESGTGKELVAQAIHRKSHRTGKPFVVINCSAYPSTLLESELFGHEKGAFTGATRQKSGRFEQAHCGTVFLDEIGEIPPSAQIRLLRVIQTQKFERLGGEQTLSVDVRILAATNRDLLQEVKNGNFREDLYYRLNVIPIHLPQLRNRRNDIPLLAKHFQRRFASEQGLPVQDFSSEAMRCLLDYHWPGNVRELENSIEHAVVLSKGARIEVSHLPSGLSAVQIKSSPGPQRSILEIEKKLLMEVLEECNWNKSQAAQRLGISRSTLYEKIKKYNILQPAVN